MTRGAFARSLSFSCSPRSSPIACCTSCFLSHTFPCPRTNPPLLSAQNLVTVWSAPNYCSRCGNLASILSFNDNLERDFKIFKWDEAAHKSYAPARPIYFL